jgi:hypothetical protein
MFDKPVFIVLFSDRDVARDAADRTNICLLDSVRSRELIVLKFD